MIKTKKLEEEHMQRPPESVTTKTMRKKASHRIHIVNRI